MLFVQQDAILEINTALKLPNIRDEELRSIRELRNKSIGHPAKRGRNGEKKSSHFIARYSVRKNGFQLMSVYEGNPVPEFEGVNIPALVRQQQSLLAKTLKETVQKLKEEEMTHKQKFQDIKMESIISNLNYPIQKLFEASWNANIPVSKASLKTINDALNSFQTQLEERHLLDSLKDQLAFFTYPISRLDDYFEGRDELASENVYIYAFFISKKIDELKQIAKDIDEEYALENTRPA